MQTRNRLLDDLARVASGAVTTLGGVREEVENRVRERLERFANDIELVTREDFEAVKAMAVKAREEQLDLGDKLAALEARLAELEAEAPRKAAPKRRAKTDPAEDDTADAS
ncbi:MAG: accessory factor UbiK family protein [Pseudomonadota bacterium]